MGTRKYIQYIFTHRKISHALNLPLKKLTTIEMFIKKITRMQKKNFEKKILKMYIQLQLIPVRVRITEERAMNAFGLARILKKKIQFEFWVQQFG